MPYNYFQQKAVYDQMNGTARKEQERAEMAKRVEEKKRPADANQIARTIVDEATEAPAKPKPVAKPSKAPKGKG